MKNSEKDSLVRQFQMVTQVESKDAREILRKHNWKLEEAIDNFFTQQNRKVQSHPSYRVSKQRTSPESSFKEIEGSVLLHSSASKTSPAEMCNSLHFRVKTRMRAMLVHF